MLLLDKDNPRKILRQSEEALLVPETEFEREGFVPNVIFPTGIVERGQTALVYYGAADSNTAVVEVSLKELIHA